MSNYILTGDDHKRNVIKITKNTSYEFNPKSNNSILQNVKKVAIYDSKTIEEIVSKKFIIKYQKLGNLIKKILEDTDASEDGVKICLDEIAKLKDILMYKYKAYLRKEIYDMFFKKLEYFDKMLLSKYYQNDFEYEGRKM